MSNSENQIFCKFRGLYKDTQENNIICESNSHFLDILRDRQLHSPSFKELNDIDEGRFSVSASQTELIKETREGKEQYRICCFALEEAKLDKDLMWAHYGNGHCGVKIDFRVDEAYRDKVFKVSYGKKPKEYSEQELEHIKEELKYDQQRALKGFIKEILTNKKQCFAYENEYRAIWKEGGDYLPIQICAITLGRRFTRETIFNNETEKIKFNENDDVVRIAKQFLNIWESGERRGGKPPRFYAYKTQYSREPEPIPPYLLQEMESLK